MATFSLHLLGTFQAEIDGQAIMEFRSNKTRTLLAYLAVESERPHRREALTVLFWPESEPRSARASLRKALSNLRKIFERWRDSEQPTLQIDQHTVTFHSQHPDFQIDTVRFDQQITATETHRHSALARCPECIEKLVAANSLYQGNFLEGLTISGAEGFDEWQAVQQEIFHKKALNALERLTHYYETVGEIDQQHNSLNTMLQLVPWDERAHRRIMILYAKTGQRNQALIQYESCRQILADELGIMPSTETVALYEAILAEDFEQVSDSLPGKLRTAFHHNLPPITSPFIGREEILADLEGRLLAPDTRLVTIFGPGGIGKTRLAQMIASRMVTRFQHGVWFISFESVGADTRGDANLSTIGTIVARSLDLPWQDQRNLLDQIADYFRSKEILVVMDNLEHLAAAATDFILWLLEQAPHISVLVTSQVRLNCRAEMIVQLSGLNLPDSSIPADALFENECVGLFTQCAQRAIGRFEITLADLPYIVELCQFLEGMPLALEMAASLLKYYDLPALTALLRQDLKLLSLPLRDVPERQRSVQAVFDYMWRLLNPAEQAVLAQASIFKGEFSREAVIDITGSSLVNLSALVDRALIRFVRPGWFVFHSLIRQFAASELERLPEQHVRARQRYRVYYTDFIQECEPRLESPEQPWVLKEIKLQADNVLKAWRWNIQQHDWVRTSKMLKGLATFYDGLGWYEDGKMIYQEALASVSQKPDREPPEDLVHQLRYWLAHFLAKLGKVNQAEGFFAELLENSTELTPVEIAQIQYELGAIALQLGQINEGIDMLERALAFFQQGGLSTSLASTLSMLGRGWELLGQYDRAETSQRQGLEIKRRLGIPDSLATALSNLGLLLHRKGENIEAKALLEEATDINRELQNRAILANTLANLALVETDLQNYDEAERLLHEARHIQEEAGNRLNLGIILNNLGDIANLKGDYEQAIAYLQTSLEIKTSMNNRGGMAFSLIHLGVAQRNRGQIEEAWRAILSALRIADEVGNHPLVLASFVEIAQILSMEGNQAKALELILLAQQDLASWQRTRDEAAELERAIAEKLSSNVIKDIAQKVDHLAIDQVTMELLLIKP